VCERALRLTLSDVCQIRMANPATGRSPMACSLAFDYSRPPQTSARPNLQAGGRSSPVRLCASVLSLVLSSTGTDVRIAGTLDTRCAHRDLPSQSRSGLATRVRRVMGAGLARRVQPRVWLLPAL